MTGLPGQLTVGVRKRGVKDDHEAFGPSMKKDVEESLGGAGLGGRLGAQFKTCVV